MALYIRMGITMIISFFTARVILQVLGVEDYGLNNVVGSVVAMFSFINGSMGTAVQRFYSIEIGKKNEDNLSKVFGTGLYLHIAVALITLIVAEIFAVFFLSQLNIPQERLFAAHVVFQISLLSLLLSILIIPYTALLRAREEFSKIAIIDVIKALLKLGLLYPLVHIDYDKLIIWSFLSFLLTLFYSLSLIKLAKKYKETKFQLIRDKILIKQMLRFVSFLVITVLASVFNKKGIVILVNLFFGLAINAAYAIAFQLSTLVNTFAMNFKQAVVPQLMSSYGSNNMQRFNKLIHLGTKVTFLLLMIVTIPLIFESHFILNLWLVEPPRFAPELTSLILIQANINVFYYFVYQAVHASGKIKNQQILTTTTYFLSVFVIFLSFKFGGSFYYAVFIPILFSVVRNIIVIYSAKKAIGFNTVYFFYNVVLRCIIFVLLLTLSILGITETLDQSFLRLFLVLLTSTVLTFGLGYYLVLNLEEKTTIKSYLPEILHRLKRHRKQ